MFKKPFVFMMVLTLLLGFTTINTTASQHFTIRLNNIILEFDAEPIMEDHRILLPLRGIAETLGVTSIEWDEEAQSVTLIYEEATLEFVIDEAYFLVDEISYPLDVPAQLIDGRTMVPIRALSEALNCDIVWDERHQTVEIEKENIQVPMDYLAETQYTYEDVMWLARIVTVETGRNTHEGKLAVANVVLNRVKSSRFPNTIVDVIFDTNWSVQFPPAHRDGFRNLVPTAGSYDAALAALNGSNNVDSCLFFNNRRFQHKASDYYDNIDGNYFYY